MANIQRNFLAGRMNKTTDKRLIGNGEYIDALNIRLGSTEKSEVGTIQNSKGNTKLTSLQYNGIPLSSSATCIGAYEDGANETLYWLIHDPAFTSSPTGKIDLICSYDTKQDSLTYHVISVNDGGGINTTLNFDPKYLFTGIDLIGGLFFFTNDYNPPRKINTTKTYNQPIAGVDGFSAESILVIKKPPTESPSISLLTTSNQNNYLEDRFLCFGYRYLYDDNEYSATSQFSDIAFIPDIFQLNTSSFLNSGMLNTSNAVEITFNTGGPLVVGVDLLFKESNSNVIKVIKKLSKKNLGYTNNTDITYTFDNSEIYTILPESEILRLYDNVPRFAKAQTIMGNRLIYGNYIDGYDLIDNQLMPIKLEYTTDLISESIGNVQLNDSSANGTYSINGSLVIPSSIVNFDLSNNPLIKGSLISFSFTFYHYSFSGSMPRPDETTDSNEILITIILNNSYASVFEFANSDEFNEAIGTSINIQPINTACDGITLTDKINCLIPTVLTGTPNSFTKIGSGITAVNQAIKIISSTSSTVIGLQIIATKYFSAVTLANVYEYYKIINAQGFYQKIGNATSLHSNRGYEVGIVYMDEFNRSSTALLSPESTEYVPCFNSYLKNSIRVTIPPTQKPPYWATRYKFVIKPDLENYNTIYSNIFFQDPNSNSVYFLLEGENATKIENGDDLIVKSDISGIATTCIYTTVLEKTAQPSGFLEIPNELAPTQNLYIPSGVYMKINPTNFNTVKEQNATVNPGTIDTKSYSIYVLQGDYPFQAYPMNKNLGAGHNPAHPLWQYADYSVPSGSVINMKIFFERIGRGTSGCNRRDYLLDKTYISRGSYDNMFEWFNGDDIEATLNSGSWNGDGERPLNDYDDTLSSTASPASKTNLGVQEGTNFYRFHRDTVTNELTLMLRSGTQPCLITFITQNKNNSASSIITNIETLRATDLIIFETLPQDALPDIFFEGSQSLAIIDGNHQGNIQNQNVNSEISAIVDTGLFNCFTFGNGVESYKILDSILGDRKSVV